jgi:hypothetical protein
MSKAVETVEKQASRLNKVARLAKLAEAIVNDITALNVDTVEQATTTNGTTPTNGVYVSGRTWAKNGKVSIYPSVVFVSDKLYRGQLTMSFEQLSLVIDSFPTLKAIAENAEAMKRLLRGNPDAVIPIATALAIVNKAE